VLTDLLGTRAREAIFDYMERNHSTSRTEIADHLNEFFWLLENLFGVTGRRVVARAIAKKMYSKLDWEFCTVAHFEFAQYLQAMRNRLANDILQKSNTSTRTNPQ
jgi:hypothetical protein